MLIIRNHVCLQVIFYLIITYYNVFRIVRTIQVINRFFFENVSVCIMLASSPSIIFMIKLFPQNEIFTLVNKEHKYNHVFIFVFILIIALILKNRTT